MRYNNIPANLFKKNRKKLQNELKENSVAIIFATDEKHRNGDQKYKYRQDSDFFYFTGIEQEKSICIISNASCKLFILKPDKKTEIWEGRKLRTHEAAEISGIDNVYYLNDFYYFFKEIVQNANTFYLYLNKKINKQIQVKRYIKKHKPNSTFEYLSKISSKLRLIKEPEEINIIKQAIEITNKAYQNVLKTVKPGLKEYEIEAVITKTFIENGASDHAYAPIIATGANACFLHYIKNDDTLKNGDLLLLDFGAEYANYAADLSRTIPVNGTFSSRQKDLYNTVLDVHKEVKKLYTPGNTINDINEKSAKLMGEKMLELGLFSSKNKNLTSKQIQQYFMHGTSHFMGLDVHDCGSKDTILKPRMILTCEPGIYIPEEKTGIRIENDILITEDKPIDLMNDFDVTISDIENKIK